MTFLEKLSAGKPMILDGPMGTELNKRGFDTTLPLWSAGAIMKSPADVEAIHRDYINAGADIITTNTFRTNFRTFLKAGLNIDDAKNATFRAVAAARHAVKMNPRKTKVWIAGSISPLEDCYRPDLSPDYGTAFNEHRQMASWLAEAEVDFLLIETMNNIREAQAATRAAAETGLPVAVSFILNDADHLLNGDNVFDAYNATIDLGATIFSINCTHHQTITDFLNKYNQIIKLPVMVYPNAGILNSAMNWQPDHSFTPQRFSEIASKWFEIGVQIIGGCCGTGPEFIGRIRK